MNENDFENDFEYYQEDKLEEDDYFILSFVNENKLNELIKEDKLDKEDKEVCSLSSISSVSKLINYSVDEYINYNYNYLTDLSKQFNITSFTNEVFFDANEYIYNIYKSYKFNWENIYSQYKKDFKRHNIFINDTQIYSRKVFEKFVDNYKTGYPNYPINSETSMSKDKLFIMLTTQSSYYFMYLFSKTFENKFREHYKNPDLYIVNGPTKTIHFENKGNKELNFCATLTLFVKDIYDDKKVLNIIYLEVNIIFDIFDKDKDKNYGILYNMIL